MGSNPRPPAAIASALRYAARGWPVLPLAPRAKRPLTASGITDASTDPDALSAWWRRWPNAGVAIACGSRSGLAVLDVDPRHGGGSSLARIQRDHGELPRSASVRTGGGGAHLYYRLPAGLAARCRCPIARKYPGLDLRGDGGYVAAPPSVHPSGEPYRWHLRERIAEAPEWLLELAAREEPGPAPSPRRAGDLRDLEAALARCPRIRARYDRDSGGLRDTTPSGVDMSLAAGLALVGLDGDAIAHAIAESRRRAGLPSKGASYMRATVRRALGARS